MLIIGWVFGASGRPGLRPAREGSRRNRNGCGRWPRDTAGAFVGVLLSTGSAAQAGAVKILVLIAVLLSQTCGVAVTIELIGHAASASAVWPSTQPLEPRS